MKCSERVAELATLLVTDAEVGAQAGIFTDDERALEIADRLRELGRIHIHSAELREGVEIPRIALDRRVQLRDLLADGVHGIALWRTAVLGGLGRGGPRPSTREMRADEQTADHETQQKATDRENNGVATHGFEVSGLRGLAMLTSRPRDFATSLPVLDQLFQHFILKPIYGVHADMVSIKYE